MSPRARAALLALFGALLLASLATGPAAAATADADNGTTTFAVQLHDDGDARWNVTVTFSLDSAAERTAFEEIAASFERGESRSLGLDAFRAASREAATVTGRSMRLTDVERAAAPQSAIDNGTGSLTVSFTWTNFARVREDGDLVVGDAFNTTEGTWLSRLEANESLVITPPADHSPFSGDGEVVEGRFRWDGPRTFTSGSPSAVFTGDGAAEPDGLPTELLAAAVLGVVLLVGLVVLVWRRDALGRSGDAAAAPDAAEPATTEPATDDEATAADEEEAGVNLELLSDEERVEWLLEQNGGRMKQATIVKETGWSNAKVSQLLSAMAEEGRIDKLRIGRENLISFPDEDVTDVDE